MTITKTLAGLTLPAVALAAFGLAATLSAPLPAVAQMDAEQPLSAQDLDEAQLDSFVAAATRVGEITDQLQIQAQGIESEAELAELQEQANMEMMAAVEEEGLTVDEYNTIFQIAQVDPELNAVLVEKMMEQQQGAPAAE